MAEGLLITPASAKRLAACVRKVAGLPPVSLAGEVNKPDFGANGFWAKITAANTDGKRYSWKRVFPDQATPGAFVEAEDGTEYVDSAYPVKGTSASVGNVVWLTHEGYGGQAGEPWFVFRGQPTSLVLVTVTNDGGQSGGENSTCDFTYSIAPVDDAITIDDDLNTELQPRRPRLQNVEYEPAPDGSYGYATFDRANGVWVLLEAIEEKPKQGDC